MLFTLICKKKYDFKFIDFTIRFLDAGGWELLVGTTIKIIKCQGTCALGSLSHRDSSHPHWKVSGSLPLVAETNMIFHFPSSHWLDL